jgi:hypothetical protein
LEREDVTGNPILIQPAPGPQGSRLLPFQVVDQPTLTCPRRVARTRHLRRPELAELLDTLDARETDRGSELFLTEQAG